jgi:hypothetical protein
MYAAVAQMVRVHSAHLWCGCTVLSRVDVSRDESAWPGMNGEVRSGMGETENLGGQARGTGEHTRRRG